MVAVQQIKEAVDCRDLIERDLGAPKHRAQRYNVYRCPLHHETKGYSLVVYQDGWICHGACNRSGDAIAWMQAYHGMSFHEALRVLGGSDELPPSRVTRPAPKVAPAEPPPAAWQRAAAALVERAQDYLWSPKGAEALAYLRQRRGLHTRYIHEFKLGYIPGERSRPYRVEAVGWVYPGWTIPWFADGQLWAVNVRREDPASEGEDDGKGKYLVFQGSRRAGALFNADSIQDRRNVLFVEGEFDAIVGAQCVDDWLAVVTLGSASNRLHPRWYSRLVAVPQIYLALDQDRAGDAARERLQELSRRTRIVRIPVGKDLTDFYLSFETGVSGVIEWLTRVERGDG